jgi:hypothetical protein
MTDMPVALFHRGIGVHAFQSARRVTRVKKQIDRVLAIADLMYLFEICDDAAWCPESRLLAAARCAAGLELATERRQARRPDIDRADIAARVADLAIREWQHPLKYCGLCEPQHERAVKRERPLPDQ